MLSDKAVRELACGKDNKYMFDLSDIDEPIYEPLLKTLQHFIPKNVETLGFNCDHLLEAKKQATYGSQMPDSIMSSIIMNRRHCVKNVAELLCFTIPRSSILKTLKISNIEFSLEQIMKIADSISKSVSFENLILKRVPIGDEGVQGLVKKLDPNQIRTLTLINCNLTKASTPLLISFAHARTTPGKGISKIDVSPHEIPQNDIVRIQKALKSLGSPSPNKLGSPKVTPKSAKGATTEKYDALLQENKLLKAELERLKNSVNAVQYNENVYVVGNGAEQFVDFLTQIESKLNQLEQARNKLKPFV